MTNEIDINRIYERNELIWGREAQKKLFEKHVIIAGLGGVGSYTAEALARCGIGKLTLIDFDTVSETNINRQLLALISDIGKFKTELMKKRIENINPHIQVVTINEFYSLSLNSQIFSEKVDFVADAIDTLKSKIDLIETCRNLDVSIISSMGAGNRLDPAQLYVADISEVKVRKCAFVKNVKHKLKIRGITEGLTVISSTEKPFITEKKEEFIEIKTAAGEDIQLRKFTPGSSPFVPPAAGYMMASHIARELIK
ncbi:MAG: tRNA threonylcarbamoyladenosine dehydratase [Candidatus Gastranaerophilales bacterium]|nr:tRNA threonylcarbamoyladenosine dehydratase [Candidatus Gastranaerophilales bacterium]